MPYRMLWLAVLLPVCVLAGCSRSTGSAPAEEGLLGLANGGVEKITQCMTVQAASLQASIGLLGFAAPENDAGANAQSLKGAAELIDQLPQDDNVRAAWKGIVAALPSVQGKGMDAANRLATSPEYKGHIETLGSWYKSHCDHDVSTAAAVAE